MKVAFVITGLLLLLLANILMMTRSSYMGAEGFQAMTGEPSMPPTGLDLPTNTPMNMKPMPANRPPLDLPTAAATTEGFTSYFLENAAGTKDTYNSIGAYDGVQLPTGNNVSVWRYTSPNEKLLGDEFVPGPDNLFMFKNNQCKPECCGASFSCGGGCVCTTPDQRNYLASRGGNRTKPEDSA